MFINKKSFLILFLTLISSAQIFCMNNLRSTSRLIYSLNKINLPSRLALSTNSQIKEANRILGLTDETDIKKIQNAYRSCMKKYHPDTNTFNNNEEANKKAKELNWAREVLIKQINEYPKKFNNKQTEKSYGKKSEYHSHDQHDKKNEYRYRPDGDNILNNKVFVVFGLLSVMSVIDYAKSKVYQYKKEVLNFNISLKGLQY